MSKNWYPLINGETCIECGKCIKQCAHGVYDKVSPKKPLVVMREGCVEGCHGCGSLCPTGSITYNSDNSGWTPPQSNFSKQVNQNINNKGGITMKNLLIEWRHLDVEGETCDRCYDTGENLAAEVKRLNRTLNPQGIEVKYIETKLDEAQIHESNMILFNNVPIEDILDIEISQSYCGSCSTLVGKDIYCRAIKFDGNEYEDVPAKAIRQAAYKALGLENENIKPSANSSCCDSGSDCGCGDTQTTSSGCCDSGSDCCGGDTQSNKGSESPMKTMAIYEPAMCCETGLCGVGVDPELIRISTVFNNLKKNGITVKRFNLSSFPQEFINNHEINKLINGEGVEALPATVVDGKIVKTKAYPTNEEIAKWLDIPLGYIGEEKTKEKITLKNLNGGCGCKGGCC